MNTSTRNRGWVRLTRSISTQKSPTTGQTLTPFLITLIPRIRSTSLRLAPFNFSTKTASLEKKKWIHNMRTFAQKRWISDFYSFRLPKMILITVYLTRISIRIIFYLARIRQPRPMMKKSKKRKSPHIVPIKKKRKNNSLCSNRLKITSIIASHYLIFLGHPK